MIVPLRTLDCAPVEPGATPVLTEAHLRRIEPLQRVLLRSLDYETVDDWRRAVNRTLQTVFDSDAAMFQLDMDGEALQYSEEFRAADVGHYTQDLMPEFARHRRLYRRALKLGAGTRWTIWRSHLDWLYRSAYFNELVSSMRAYDPLWLATPCPGSSYPAMLHTYHDRRRTPHFFDATDAALLKVVRPAFEAGVSAVLRMRARRASLTAALDSRQDGILLYDLGGGLLHRNVAIGRLVPSRDAERALLEAGARMAMGMAAADLRSALHPANTARTVSTRAGDYRLSAVQVAEGTFGPGPAVLITVSAVEASLPGRGALRARFGLTRRQAEVALLLARRRTNPEIADQLCISTHTVRSHVEAVMAKLSVHDRREVRTALTAQTGAD